MTVCVSVSSPLCLCVCLSVCLSVCLAVRLIIIGYKLFFAKIYENVFTPTLGDAGIGSAWGTILVGGIGPVPGPLTSGLSVCLFICLSVSPSVCLSIRRKKGNYVEHSCCCLRLVCLQKLQNTLEKKTRKTG